MMYGEYLERAKKLRSIHPALCFSFFGSVACYYVVEAMLSVSWYTYNKNDWLMRRGRVFAA